MYSKGLKTSIILNLLFVIAAAMLLIDLVMVGSARQELLKNRLETGGALLTIAGHVLHTPLLDEERTVSALTTALKEASADCLLAVNSTGENVYTAGPDCTSVENLKRDVLHSLESGTERSSFAGVTRGILWPDRKNMLVSRPLLNDGEVLGATGVSLDLEGIYLSLRNSQRIFFIYFLVNLMVFTMLGFYHLYRWLLRPIKRLVATAEEFHDDEELAFFAETRAGEFNRLSDTFNKMFARINRDRGRLQKTIADLEEANLILRKTQQEMVRAEKMASVGHLSAGIAHEIGNPIGIVIGYLDLLKQPSITDDQKKDFIVRADREVNRINTIIRQLLDFARQPSDERPVEISVHEAINDVVDICSVQPMMAGIEIEVQNAAAEDLVVGTDGQLKQVFLNLLLNAADAINCVKSDQKEGRIRIKTVNLKKNSAKDVADYIKIQFIDNGPGIETSKLDDIFDPFYTTKEPGKGTGLGLSICFTLVENMAGDIKAASDSEGTMITVMLPLAIKHDDCGETIG